jgi:hypothetical protein
MGHCLQLLLAFSTNSGRARVEGDDLAFFKSATVPGLYGLAASIPYNMAIS